VAETKVTEQLTTEQMRELGAINPMGRLVRPDEVARTVAFLASEDSGFTTGHYLPVNGGLPWIETRFRRDGSHQIGGGVFSHAHDRPGRRDIHEELVAYVADKEGYYEDEGVHVAIRDGVSWETERLRRGATIGLGRALLSRLTDGIGWKVLSVNTHRPLFRFFGSADVKSMADLRGRRLAVHAAHTTPGCFARIVLRKHGLDPRDMECVVRLQVTTRWTCDAFGTTPSTPPT